MVVLMVVAAMYAVLQLALVTLGGRTLRASTLLLAVATGCYGCGVLAILAEVAYTRAVQALTGEPLHAVVRTASYSVDPVIEELVKVMPIIVAVAVLRRLVQQLGLVDFVLAGAALGSGFGLAEALLRYAGQASRAIPYGRGGYLVPTSIDAPTILGLPSVLTTWLPPAVSTSDLFGAGGGLNHHLIWSALAGFGLGVVVRLTGPRRWLGVIPLAYAGADHVAINYSLRHLGLVGWSGGLLNVMSAVRVVAPGLVLAAVAVALALDARAIRAARIQHPDLLLAAERTGSWRAAALIRAALVAPPWTPLVVSSFLLLRRSTWHAVASAPGQPYQAAAVVAQLAYQIDRAGDRVRWRQAAGGLSRRSVSSLVRDWRVLIWVILLLPAVAYLVVGAVPVTSGLQQAMASAPGLMILRIVGILAVIYLVGQVAGIVRRLPESIRRQHSEAVTRALFRLLTAAGALAAGVALVVRSWSASSGARVLGFHILDALSAIALVAALALVLAALFYFPPIALVGLAGGGAILVVSPAAATSVGMIAGAAALGSLGVLLSKASESPRPPPSPAPKGSGRKKGVNLDPGTRAQVREKLPAEWGEGRANDKGVGTRWQDPGYDGNGVRVDEGNPKSSLPSQRVDHVIVRYKGEVIGPDGKPVPESIAKSWEAHVPLDDWMKWSRWWRP